MSLLGRLEEALERIIEGGVTRVTGGSVHPLEIARRLQSAMEEGRLLSTQTPYVPNQYVVTLADCDLEHMGEVADEIAWELARHLERHAAAQGWAYGGGVSVWLRGGGSPGQIAIESDFDQQAPGALLQIEGGELSREFRVGERAIIGRDPECEILLSDPTVSRRHAELEWTYQGYRLRDLNSRNGTFVNAEQVDETLLEDGDLIEVGLVQLRFRQLGR